MKNQIEEYSKLDTRVRLGLCIGFVLGIPIFQAHILDFFEGNHVMMMVIKGLMFCFGIFSIWSLKILWPWMLNRKLTNQLKQDEFRQAIINKTIKVTALVMYVMIAVGFFIGNHIDVSLKFAFGVMLYITTVVASVTYSFLNRG
tara:strand:- start:125 stop:556 length:432 start_codon:yes stop_codon:yes gene_type:complete